MRHHDIDPPSGSAPLRQPDVRTLAERALSTIAEKKLRKSAALKSDDLDLLCASLVDGHENAHGTAISQLCARGITIRDIADHYVPAAARRIGDRWVRDECSFVDVTIASSRLQRALRGLSVEVTRASPDSFDPAHRALVIVPKGEQHTLGAFLAASQLRRAGLATEIAIDLDVPALRRRIAADRFSILGISAGTERTLGKLKTLTDSLLSGGDDDPGIVIGGWAVDTFPEEVEALRPRLIGTTVTEALGYLARSKAPRARDLAHAY